MKRHLLIFLFLLVPYLGTWAASCPTDSIITYDKNGQIISKTLYQYDEAGRTTLEERWSMNSDSVLVGSSKYTTEYYNDGKVKSTASYNWSTLTNNWKGTNRLDYEYNNQGLTTLRKEWMWSIQTNNWRDSLKYEYTYDAQGNTLSNTSFLWSVVSGVWTCDKKSEYEYDGSNRKVLEIRYIGNGTSWIPQAKQEYNYDQNGNTILDRSYSGYDATAKIWIGSHWYIYGYDRSNRTTLNEKYNWDTSINDWVGASKYFNWVAVRAGAREKTTV